MRKLATAAGIGLGIVALVAGAHSVRASGNSYTGQTPPEITVSNWLNRQPTTLGELKGQVVLLEFWATT